MKPTGAMKEATGHSPLPWQWLPDEGQFIVDAKGNIVAEIPCQGCNPIDGEFLVTAVNERERLRAAIQKFVDAYSNGKEARLGNGQARRSLDEFRQLLNDATPSISAGGG